MNPVFAWLRHIPQSNQTPVPLSTLVSAEALPSAQGVALLLRLWGVVDYDAEAQHIRAASQTALYFLHSLAAYDEASAPIIADWKLRGINPDATGNPLQNGATLLYWLEKRRMALPSEAPPVRHTKVAQAIIKRQNADGDTELLMQYDTRASQFQLIGGRHSERDGDSLATTMQRELIEELPSLAALRPGVDYELRPLLAGISSAPTLSRTFGALTSYEFWVYHLVGLRAPIALSIDDRWLPLPWLLAQQPSDESALNLIALFNRHIPGGIASLADSHLTP